DPDGRGVVAAASYEARKFGVHSAQPIGQAKKLCPHAIFLRGHYEKYREYSEKVCRIFGEFTPIVEMVSIDEAYLDLTGCERLYGSALRAADILIRAVKEKTKLNCSVGASTSHLVSKIASDQAKPHGLLCVIPGCEAKFLAPLPVRRMPGIGKVTEPQLLSLGISTFGDLQASSLEKLKEKFGKWGEYIYTKSRGEDIEAYAYEEEPKSISHETTFDADTADGEEVERAFSNLSQLVARRLRDHKLFARTVGLKLRFTGFETLTRDVTLDEPTHLDSVIFSIVLRLLDSAWNRKRKVRLVGVRASKLERAVFQLNLLEAPKRDKLDRVFDAADKLRARYGFDAVKLARSLEPGEEPKPRRRFLGRE
ncbi:MAG TPA: DNA polymerase IV, partial [Terriglobia bacterium]|nr:DNA polymerase IV [Terriglobia bacterium]